VRAAFDGDLDDWGDARGDGGRRYADTVRCTNRSLLDAVDEITERDPDALVFLQGDHGPGFGIDTDRPVPDWPDADIAQRYGILSAARLPERCGRRAPETPVNTFRIALACVTGEDIPLLEPRRFALGYEDDDRVEALPR
jgi:hypothetical protein